MDGAKAAQTNIIRLERLARQCLASLPADPKALLALLRELALYADGLSVQQHQALLEGLLSTAKELPDRDVERKVVRIIVFLVAGAVARGSSSPHSSPGPQLYEYLNLEVVKASGSRQAFAIKSLGQVARSVGRLEEVISSLTQLLLRLRYPVRRKVLLLGQKKADHEFDTAVQVWNAIMVSLRINQHCPPALLDDALFTAVQSENPALARHGMALIAAAAQNRESGEVHMLAVALLGRLKGGVLNLRDALCGSYLTMALTSFANSSSMPVYVCADLFDALYSMQQDKINCVALPEGSKLCADLVRSFASNSRNWEIKTELSKRYLDLLSHLLQAVERHITALDVANVALPMMLRAAAVLGEFIVSCKPGGLVTSREEDDAMQLLNGCLAKIDSTLSWGPHVYADALRATVWLLPTKLSATRQSLLRVVASRLCSPRSIVILGHNLGVSLFYTLLKRVSKTMPASSLRDTIFVLVVDFAELLSAHFHTSDACTTLSATWAWLSDQICSSCHCWPASPTITDSATSTGSGAASRRWRRKLIETLLTSCSKQLKHEFSSLDDGSTVVLQGLRGRAFHTLAEHGLMCLNTQADAKQKLKQEQRVLEIVDILFVGAIVEGDATRLLCVQGLGKFSLRLYALSRIAAELSGAGLWGALSTAIITRLVNVVVRGDETMKKQASAWPSLGIHVVSAGQTSASLALTLRQLEKMPQTREAAWGRICAPSDSSFELWKSSVLLHSSSGAYDEDQREEEEEDERSSKQLLEYNAKRAAELPLYADVFLPSTPAPYSSQIVLEELLPPPPTSPAPIVPPKPLRTRTQSLSSSGISSDEQQRPNSSDFSATFFQPTAVVNIGSVGSSIESDAQLLPIFAPPPVPLHPPTIFPSVDSFDNFSSTPPPPLPPLPPLPPHAPPAPPAPGGSEVWQAQDNPQAQVQFLSSNQAQYSSVGAQLRDLNDPFFELTSLIPSSGLAHVALQPALHGIFTQLEAPTAATPAAPAPAPALTLTPAGPQERRPSLIPTTTTTTTTKGLLAPPPDKGLGRRKPA